MAINYCADSIFGSFWRLDTQGEESARLQQGLCEDEDVARKQAAKPMIRSASEWAFQEFLREHALPSLGKTGTKSCTAEEGEEEEDDAKEEEQERKDGEYAINELQKQRS